MRNVLTIAELEAETTELLPTRETLFVRQQQLGRRLRVNSSLALNAASILRSRQQRRCPDIVVSQG